MSTSLYYSDPDQNLVELQVDNFGNWDASTEFMRTSEDFRQNPAGAFFDRDRVLTAYKAGATFEQLQKDTYAGTAARSRSAADVGGEFIGGIVAAYDNTTTSKIYPGSGHSWPDRMHSAILQQIGL